MPSFNLAFCESSLRLAPRGMVVGIKAANFNRASPPSPNYFARILTLERLDETSADVKCDYDVYSNTNFAPSVTRRDGLLYAGLWFLSLPLVASKGT